MRGYVEDGNEEGGNEDCRSILCVDIVYTPADKLERSILMVKRCLNVDGGLGGQTEVGEMH
jgi:hypothetical protein